MGAPAFDRPVDEQRDHGADDRTDQAGRLERAVLTVLVEQRVADETTDERPDDAEEDRGRYRHRIGAGHEGTGEESGDDADEQEEEDETDHESAFQAVEVRSETVGLPGTTVDERSNQPSYIGAVDLDADLIAYYEAEALSRRRTGVGEYRQGLRDTFAELVRAEGRRHMIDVGAGPGRDTAAWRSDGVDMVGVDLTHENVRLMREQDLNAVTGSLYHLPFRSGSFDSLWTMSTFVHVPHERFDEAITEMIRVLTPGAPLAIGTWGGVDFEGIAPFGDLRPHRFFSLATHDRWREMLARHGDVETFADPRPEHRRRLGVPVRRRPITWCVGARHQRTRLTADPQP